MQITETFHKHVIFPTKSCKQIWEPIPYKPAGFFGCGRWIGLMSDADVTLLSNVVAFLGLPPSLSCSYGIWGSVSLRGDRQGSSSGGGSPWDSGVRRNGTGCKIFGS